MAASVLSTATSAAVHPVDIGQQQHLYYQQQPQQQFIL
jgi:hypothetical protein